MTPERRPTEAELRAAADGPVFREEEPERRRLGCSVLLLVLAFVTAAPSQPVAAMPSAGAPVSVPATSGLVPALVGGWATYYRDRKHGPDEHYAAAGPLLREAFGDWRGKVIRVRSGKHSTIVSLSDSCACGERAGLPTLIDLSPAAFRDLAPLSAGVIRVSIEVVELPATDSTGVPRTADDIRMMLEVREP